MKQVPGKIFDTAVYLKMIVFIGINLFVINKPLGPIFYAVILINILAVLVSTFRFIWLKRLGDSKITDLIIPLLFLLITILMYVMTLEDNLFLIVLSLNIIALILLIYKIFLAWRT